MKICITYITLTFILIFCLLSTKINAQVNDEEAIELYPSFNHRGVVNTVVISYYKNDTFYLPLVELFGALQIDYETDLNNNTIRIYGSYLEDGTPYEINLATLRGNNGSKNIQLNSSDFIVGELDYYFTPRVFKELFKLDFKMDLNSLALTLDSENTLPIVSKFFREQKRKRSANNSYSDKNYDLKYSRDRSFLSGGFLDYNISQVYSPNSNVTTLSNSLGFELAGGDVQGSIIGSYSDEYSVFETNNLRWRYVVRDTPAFTSISLGQVRSDGLLRDSYTGVRISNDPIEPRRLYDEFRISGNATPQSEVELYLNNVLIDFENADGLGSYNFLVPLTYGLSNYNVRVYSPTGQVQEISKNIQIPFSFTRPGEVNYHINAGALDNRQIGTLDRDYLLNGDVSVGLNNWLSGKIGAEYYESIGTPTYKSSLSARIFSKYLVNAEYASDAYFRSSANVVYANSASIGISYTDFLTDFSIFNLSQDQKQFNVNTFMPVNFLGLPGNFRINVFSRIRETLNNTRIRLDAAFRKNRLNARFSYFDTFLGDINSLSPTNTARIQNSLTYTISRANNIPGIIKGTFLRTQLTFLPKLNIMEEAEFVLSRNVFKQGRIQFVYGRNFINNFDSFGINLVFDFNKIRSNTSARSVRNSSTITQNLRGSIGFDNSNGNVLLTSRQQVGRSATAFRLFVDNNGNNVFDEGDKAINESAIRVDRAGATSYSKDGITYLSQLQPYFKYNMEVVKSSIKNPLLVPQFEKFGLVTDPNQFKPVEIPFYISGVIEGNVYRYVNQEKTVAVPGLKLQLTREDSDFYQELRTFSDGSFYSYEVPPGNYKLTVDQSQLDILDVVATPNSLEFEVKALSQGDFVEGLNFLLAPEGFEQKKAEQVPTETIIADISQSSDIIEYETQLDEDIDKTLRLIIQAQTAFYNKNIDGALTLVNESLSLFKTAQGYALRGSLFYLKGNKIEAQKNWDLAIEFNPDIFIPDIEVLDQLIRTQPGN